MEMTGIEIILKESNITKEKFFRELSKNKNFITQLCEQVMKLDDNITIISELSNAGKNKTETNGFNIINEKLETVLKLLNSDSETLNESSLSLKPTINISLDNDGSLLIHKHESVDFMTIYSNSHKLLKEYEKVDNIDGIKYELFKLQMMLILIDKKYLYNKSITNILVTKDKKNQMIKAKAFILGDFHKYLNFVLSKDNSFNFNDEFMKSPFGVETYKIDERIFKAGKLLRQII